MQLKLREDYRKQRYLWSQYINQYHVKDAKELQIYLNYQIAQIFLQYIPVLIS